MKKLILSVVALAAVTFVSVEAKANYNVVATVEVEGETETAVKAEELPEAVKKALSGEAYAKWQIATAAHVTGGAADYFKIELTQGEQKQVVKLDKEGSLVK